MSAVALVCVRNEALHLRACVGDFVRQGVDVILIDNDSTDGSIAAIREEFLGKGLLSIERLPWRGAFSLTEQLAVKKKLIESVTHDWIIHADADEWLQAPPEYGSLMEGIRAADGDGFNCINFLEFVFLPRPGEDFEVDNYRSLMRDYYFFHPSHPRLVRAWKRSAGLDNSPSGGHTVAGGEVRLFPRDFILRHYIALSESHARRKYSARTFAPEDLAAGFHGNRMRIAERDLTLRPDFPLLRMDDPHCPDFSTRFPHRRHFWAWPDTRR